MLLLLPLSRTACAQDQTKLGQQTAKARAEVARRGTGEKSRVRIKLRGGVEVKGYISQASEDKFTIVNQETGSPTVIAYSDVEKVRGKGGLGKGAKIGIIAGIGGGLFVTYLAVTFARINGVWR